MEDIIGIVLDLAGTLLGAGFVYLLNIAIKEWKLGRLVTSFVRAADQLYKDMDEDGSIRLAYVESQLIDAGIKLTEAVRAKVEEKVLELNMEQTALRGEGK